MPPQPQRVRVWFRKSERVRYISHLDVLRYWERVFRRAGLPLSYSKGFTPHPKLAFAAPLPMGFVAEGEIVDATLDDSTPVADIRAALAGQTSDDLALVDAADVLVTGPPPQSALEWADYRFDVSGVSPAQFAAGVEVFLARDTFEWVDERREKARTYDMRAGVASITVRDVDGLARVEARLSASQEFTVRPEEVLKALAPGGSVAVYTRVALLLNESAAPVASGSQR